jgi:hypothetical protein
MPFFESILYFWWNWFLIFIILIFIFIISLWKKLFNLWAFKKDQVGKLKLKQTYKLWIRLFLIRKNIKLNSHWNSFKITVFLFLKFSTLILFYKSKYYVITLSNYNLLISNFLLSKSKWAIDLSSLIQRENTILTSLIIKISMKESLKQIMTERINQSSHPFMECHLKNFINSCLKTRYNFN